MQTTEKLSITLTRELAEMIRGKVRAGAYTSSSEVIREALRLRQEQEDRETQKLVWLRERIDRAPADPRPSLEADEVFARLAQSEAGEAATGLCGPFATCLRRPMTAAPGPPWPDCGRRSCRASA